MNENGNVIVKEKKKGNLPLIVALAIASVIFTVVTVYLSLKYPTQSQIKSQELLHSLGQPPQVFDSNLILITALSAAISIVISVIIYKIILKICKCDTISTSLLLQNLLISSVVTGFFTVLIMALHKTSMDNIIIKAVVPFIGSGLFCYLMYTDMEDKPFKILTGIVVAFTIIQVVISLKF